MSKAFEAHLDAIQNAIEYADGHGAAYQLHVTMTDGRRITGTTRGPGAQGIGVEDADDCTFVHFINPAHVAFVKLEWL